MSPTKTRRRHRTPTKPVSTAEPAAPAKFPRRQARVRQPKKQQNGENSAKVAKDRLPLLERSTKTQPPEHDPIGQKSVGPRGTDDKIPYMTIAEQRALGERAFRAAQDQTFFPEVEHYTRRAFLYAYLETMNKRMAARSLGIGEWTPHSVSWKQDEPFMLACTSIEEAIGDSLEREAYRRGVEGVEEPTGWYKGVPGGYVKKFSDSLLLALLKAYRPDKYREKVEVRGLLANLDMNKLPHEAIERIARGEPTLAVLADLASREQSLREHSLLPAGEADIEQDTLSEEDV